MSDADVIVVGGGGSGLAAAAEAAGLGRKVVLLEKGERLGGSTAWSVGSISASNTPHQRRAGIVDHPDAHFEDLESLAGPMANRDNRALRRLLVDNITDTLAWLEKAGLVFAGPNPEPPHRLPRMHNVLPNSRAFPEVLGRLCRRLGVDIRLGTLADGIIVEGGRAVGVKVRAGSGGSLRDLRAAGGVVLAGGDFAGNAEMKATYAGPATAKIDAVNPGATGDALRIGLEAGAEIVNGDIVRGPIMRFVPPSHESLLRRMPPRRWVGLTMATADRYLPASMKRPVMMRFLLTALGPSRELFEAGALLINRDGRRFVDELGQPGAAVPDQPERLAYIVMSAATARRFSAWPHFISTAPGIAYAYLDDYRKGRPDIFHEASDAAGLATALGVPADALQASLAEPGKDGGPRIADGPLVALGPVKSYMIFTDGGLRVNEHHEVLARGTGTPIPGLYAAGSTGQGGVLLEGHGHHLGWAFVSGRRAGRNAALEVPAALPKA